MTTLPSRTQETSVEERLRQKKERLRGAELRIRNLTQGLTVVSLEKDVDRDLIRVILRNDYEKAITAYKVAIGVGTIQTEFITEETGDTAVLYPRGLREEMYPLQVDVETLGIRILAVIFDDKTSDGEPQAVREIQDYRLGMKMGLEQALELLRDTVRLPNADMSQALARVQLQLSQGSESVEKKLPHFVGVGLRDVRHRIARGLLVKQNPLLNNPDSASESRDRLVALLDRLRGTISKL